MSNPFANLPNFQLPVKHGDGGDENIAKRSDRESMSDSEREESEQDTRRSPVPRAKATTTRERNTDPFVDYETNPPQPKYAETALQTLQSAVRVSETDLVDLPDNPEDALKRLDELRLAEKAGWLSSQPFREKNEYLRFKLDEFRQLREAQREVSDFSELQEQLSKSQKQSSELQTQNFELQQQNLNLQKQLSEVQNQLSESQKQVSELQKQSPDLHKQLEDAKATRDKLAELLQDACDDRDQLNAEADDPSAEADKLVALCRANGIRAYPPRSTE